MPRACEQIRESMLEVGRQNSALKQAIAGWAKGHALAAARGRQLGGDGSTTFGYAIARRVLGKVKEALGSDRYWPLLAVTGRYCP